jgi:hypothetical protein
MDPWNAPRGITEVVEQKVTDGLGVAGERGVFEHTPRPQRREHRGGLERHQSLEVRIIPGGPRAVLIDPAPHGVVDPALSGEGLAGARPCGGVTLRRAQELDLEVVAEGDLLVRAPAPLRGVVRAVHLVEGVGEAVIERK